MKEVIIPNGSIAVETAGVKLRYMKTISKDIKRILQEKECDFEIL